MIVICQTSYKAPKIQTSIYSKSCNVLKEAREVYMKSFKSTEIKQLVLVCGNGKHNIR